MYRYLFALCCFVGLSCNAAEAQEHPLKRRGGARNLGGTALTAAQQALVVLGAPAPRRSPTSPASASEQQCQHDKSKRANCGESGNVIEMQKERERRKQERREQEALEKRKRTEREAQEKAEQAARRQELSAPSGIFKFTAEELRILHAQVAKKEAEQAEQANTKKGFVRVTKEPSGRYRRGAANDGSS